MTDNKQKITNKKQFELLIGILEENPSVAKGLQYAECASLGREQFNDVWKEITATLNSAGPSTRKTPEWQKVWSDLKLKVKRKLQKNKKEVNATGGGPNRLQILSTYEEAVVNLLSLDKTTDHAGPSFGLAPQPSPTPITTDYKNWSDSEDEAGIGMNGAETIVPPVVTPVITRRRTAKNYRQKLLEDQTNYMKELVENSRESLQLQREALQLQKEKLLLKKEYIGRIEKQRADELKFQLQMLEYKKMKLEITRSNTEM